MAAQEIFLPHLGKSFFDGNVSDKLMCVICSGVLRDAVSMNCPAGKEHRYCSTCINTYLEKATHCPVDKDCPITPVERRSLKKCELARDIINEEMDLNCCPLHCGPWRGTVNLLKFHLQAECPNYEIPCKYAPECDIKASRKDITDHELSCFHRTFTCPHCSQKVLFKSEHSHMISCPQFPVPCAAANSGCTAIIPRSQLQDHLSSECEHVERVCTYNQFGCKIKGKKAELAAHMRTADDEHVQLATAKMNELKEQHAVKCREVDALKQQIESAGQAAVDAFQKRRREEEKEAGQTRQLRPRLEDKVETPSPVSSSSFSAAVSISRPLPVASSSSSSSSSHSWLPVLHWTSLSDMTTRLKSMLSTMQVNKGEVDCVRMSGLSPRPGCKLPFITLPNGKKMPKFPSGYPYIDILMNDDERLSPGRMVVAVVTTKNTYVDSVACFHFLNPDSTKPPVVGNAAQFIGPAKKIRRHYFMMDDYLSDNRITELLNTFEVGDMYLILVTDRSKNNRTFGAIPLFRLEPDN